jgi:flagellar biosynthetic protein FlhB
MAVEGLRLVLKIGATVFVSYGILKTQAWIAPSYSFVDLQTTGSIMGATAKELFSSLVLVLAVFAGVDYFFQRQEFMKNVRLTKQEAKQEYKEREGDPAIKARIRAIQRDVARKRMMAAVKKADVIVTNPTHIAIAIQYDRENMSAPKVVAKGADFVAQKIKQLASEAGVPMVENVPLARTLYKTVKVNQAIPRALYQAVAEVLAYVYRLKNRRF